MNLASARAAFFFGRFGSSSTGLHQSVIGGVGGVVLHHVEDEPFLDGLPHGVEMKRLRLPVRARAPEQLQRLPFGRRGEGEEAQVRLPPARLHHLVQTVFPIRFFLVVLRLRCRTEDGFQLPRRLAGLAGVRLVHDDCITSLGDFRLPASPAAFLFRRSLSPGSPRQPHEEPAQHERKFLQAW